MATVNTLHLLWRVGDKLNVMLLAPIHVDGVTIPKNFRTDFATVPRFLHSTIRPYGRHTVAAIYHDYLYCTQPEGITREDADKLFKKVMREYSVKAWHVHAMYQAVRLFGGKYWKKCAN